MSTRNSAKSTSATPEKLSYCALLYKICQEEGIALQFLSTNWVKRLEKGGQVRYIVGYKFDLNSAAASLLADDKTATYELLNAMQIPVASHQILYEFTNQGNYTLGRNNLEYVRKFFEQHRQNIVIKPNCGTGGRNSYHVTAREQIAPALMEVFYANPTAALSPFYEIKAEYRVILLDSKARLTYMKVLQNAEDWKFNLQQGAKAQKIPETKKSSIVKLAKQAAKASGLRFCSVDIIETAQGEMLVLEINSGVMIEKYLQQHPEDIEKVKDLYRDAIRRMFEVGDA